MNNEYGALAGTGDRAGWSGDRDAITDNPLTWSAGDLIKPYLLTGTITTSAYDPAGEPRTRESDTLLSGCVYIGLCICTMVLRYVFIRTFVFHSCTKVTGLIRDRYRFDAGSSAYPSGSGTRAEAL